MHSPLTKSSFKFKFKVKIYTDSTEAIQLLFTNISEHHPLEQLIQEARELIFLDWDMQIIHVHREALTCADYLAKCGHDTDRELKLLQNPSAFCSDQMLADWANIG